MFTVLILNQKTTESFNEYYPLFLDAIRNEEIGVCRWYEAGGDIESILPDLHALTDDKKAWRAVIVRTEEDMNLYETSNKNPYDYLVNSEKTTDVIESDIPLVRLTHYLGGYPSPEVEFKAEIIGDIRYKIDENGEMVERPKEEYSVEDISEDATPRIIYQSVKNQEKEARFNELFEKYDYYGKKPDEIILITIRKKENIPETYNLVDTWTDFLEIHSSNFWQRNNYPSKCRFVVFDTTNDGPVQKETDMFKFWSSVFMVCTNKIPPSYLQAYRLYNINTEISIDDMRDVMQRTATQLVSARAFIDRTIREDIERKLHEKKTLPDFRVGIPVSIESPQKALFEINTDKFSLVPSSYNEDKFVWQDMKTDAYNELDNCIDRSEKALDESTDILRQAADASNETIQPLDKYQKKEMESQLAGIYSNIIKLQGQLPKSRVHYQSKLVDTEKSIRKQMQKRVSSTQFSTLLSAMAFCVLFALVPAGIFYANDSLGNIPFMLIAFAVILAALGITQLVVLLLQKKDLGEEISTYNEGLDSSVGEMGTNAHLYSDFLSAIASYTKGKSYLKLLSKMKYEDDNSYVTQKKHIKAIDTFIKSIEAWDNAFELDISFELNENEEYEVDFDETPDMCAAYALYADIEKDVPINCSGELIESSYTFIDKFILEREELYDESRN